MRISDWSSDVCSSDLGDRGRRAVLDDPRRRLRLPRIERRAVEQHDGVGGRGAGDGAGRDHRRMRTVRIVNAPLSAGQHRRVLEPGRSEEHTSELQTLMRISYAVFSLKKIK